MQSSRGKCRAKTVRRHFGRKSVLGQAFLEVDGFCPVCSAPARFRSDSTWLRDFFRCEGCGTIPRERAFMAAIEMFYPQWRTLNVHESAPAQGGVSLRLQRECSGYTASFYVPTVPLGGIHPERGYRCENIEALT